MMYEMNEDVKELRESVKEAHKRIDLLESLLMSDRPGIVPDTIINGTFFTAPFVAIGEMFKGVK